MTTNTHNIIFPDLLPNFTLSEFECSETGQNEMQGNFIIALQHLRILCGFAFTILSGFRSVLHSEEVGKVGTTGQHPKGLAADIYVANGVQRRLIVGFAVMLGFTGIGIKKHMVHVDMRVLKEGEEPVLWVY